MESSLLMEVKVTSPLLVFNPWKLPIFDSLKQLICQENLHFYPSVPS